MLFQKGLTADNCWWAARARSNSRAARSSSLSRVSWQGSRSIRFDGRGSVPVRVSSALISRPVSPLFESLCRSGGDGAVGTDVYALDHQLHEARLLCGEELVPERIETRLTTEREQIGAGLTSSAVLWPCPSATMREGLRSSLAKSSIRDFRRRLRFFVSPSLVSLLNMTSAKASAISPRTR